MGDELDAILTESLCVALDTGALDPSTPPEITVDTTVMEKNVTRRTEGKLMVKAAHAIVKLCKSQGIKQRRTYKAELKHAHMMANRYAHVKQRKRIKRQLRLIYSRLGRLTREAQRKVDANPNLHPALASTLGRAKQVRLECTPRRKTNVGRSIFSWHVPEVECIGKGKAHKPFEFGVKASVVTPNQPSPGRVFVLDCEALHGKPHDGHTLKRAIEPVIDHLKNDGCMGRNYLSGKHDDKINAIIAAVGYNSRQILN